MHFCASHLKFNFVFPLLGLNRELNVRLQRGIILKGALPQIIKRVFCCQ